MSEETADSRQTYAAFISYSHADNREEGRKWADWLHHELETYEVPADLVGKPNRAGKPIPANIYPVFQDEKELSASSNLTSALTTALDASAYLVYLSSPRSARSVYVGEELRHFKRTGKSDRIIALILAGEPEYGTESTEQQCFPEVLRYRVDESGKIDHSVAQEPIAADARLPGTQEQGYTTPQAYRQVLQDDRTLSRKEVDRRVQAYKDRLELAKLKIIAGVLDVPLGDLTQRDQAYQLVKARQRTKIVKRIAVVIGVLALMAVALGIYAWTERNSAQTMLSRSLFLSGLNRIDQREVAEGAAYMAAATRYGNERTALFVQSMLMRENGMTLMPRVESAPVFSPDGHWIAAVDASSNAKRGVQIWDAYTQKLHTILSDVNASSLSKMKFDNRNVLYFTRADSKIGAWEEGKPARIAYEMPADLRIATFTPDDKGDWLVVQGWTGTNDEAQYIKSQIVNLRTGQVVVDEVPTPRSQSTSSERVAIDPQGRAIAFYASDENNSRVLVYPVNAEGQLQEARNYPVPGGVMKVEFSPDAQHLFARTIKGMYHIDLQRDDRQISKVPAKFASADVYFSDEGKTYTTLWTGQYTVHDMATDKVLLTGESAINLQRLLEDISSGVSPDMTQRVVNQQGSYYLVTDLAPSLLRSQFVLDSDLVSLYATPDSSGVLFLKKNSHSLQYLALDGKGGVRDFVNTPSAISYFGVLTENDLVYAVSTPEKDGFNQLRFFRAGTGKPVGKTMSVKGLLSFSHDGTQFSSRIDDTHLGIWNIETGERVRTVELKKKEKYKLSEDLSTLLSLDERGNWRVTDIATGKELHQESTPIKGAFFTPDNKYLLTFFNDRAQLYDLTDFTKPLAFPTAGDLPKARLSPDSKVLAVAEDNKYIRLWNLEKQRPIGQKIKNDALGGYMNFSADSKYLFTTDPQTLGSDKGIAMYDTTTAVPVVMPFGISRVTDVEMMPDGKDILTLDVRADQVVLNVWAVPNALLAPANELADQTEIYFGKKYDSESAAVIDAPGVSQRPDSWFFQDPYVRPPVPGSSRPLTAYLDKYIPVRDDDQLRLIDRYWRFHPMARAALAVYYSKNKDTAFVARSLSHMVRLQLNRVKDAGVREKTTALLDQVQKNMQEHP